MKLKLHDYQQTQIITLVQNLQFLAQFCLKYHKKPEGSDQYLQISENILNKNYNGPSTVRHTKLTKRKIVMALVLCDTLNLSKESLISTYLTSTSLLFIKHHDQSFVLNWVRTERKVHIFQNIASTTHSTKRLRLQKMKTDFKKKKLPKCPAGCQPLPEN